MKVVIDQKELSLENYRAVVYNRVPVVLSKRGTERINKTREKFLKIVASGKPIYSISTGVGKLADRTIHKNLRRKLQLNIIKSHSAGWGKPLSEELVRGAMLLRANSLFKGYSGVRSIIIRALIDFLNHNITPFVPSKGSVGASGDLAPLSHIALCLIGEGEVFYKGAKEPTYLVLKKADIKPVELQEKEGIALINGTEFTLALLLDAYFKFMRNFELAFLSSLFTFVLLDGKREVFDARIHRLKRSKEVELIAMIMRKKLKGYKPRYSNRKSVQDPYTIRCIPQVLGAVMEIANFVLKILNQEMNAITDNPLLIDGKIISGGNFHGQRLSFAGDILSIAITTLSNFLERQVFQLMGAQEQIPRFLTSDDGLHSGFMIAQVTASALASENKILVHPASSDSIPTSLNQEDFVSMSWTSAGRLFPLLDNLRGIVVIALASVLQGIDLLGVKVPTPLRSFYERIREKVPYNSDDHPLYRDFEKLNKFLEEEMKDVKIIL